MTWPTTADTGRSGELALHGAALLVVGAYAWWVAGLAHFTLSALLAVLAAGSVTVALARWLRRPSGPARHAWVAPWVPVLGALVAWELLAFSLTPRSTHPTLSSLADAALAPRPVEAAAFMVWLGLGWRLAGR